MLSAKKRLARHKCRMSNVLEPRRLKFEALEDRTLLALPVQVGSLGFVGNFTRSSPFQYTAIGGDVLLGYEPSTPDGVFQGLLDIKLGTSGELDLDTSKTTFSFRQATVNLIVQATQGAGAGTPIYKTADSTPTTWDVTKLVSNFGQAVAGGVPFSARGITVTLTGLYFSDSGSGESSSNAEVRMQGTAAFASTQITALNKFSALIDGNNYLIANASGYQLTGLTVSLATGLSYDFAGVTASLSQLSVTYADDGGHDEYSFSGVASITTKAQDTTQKSAISGVQVGLGLAIEDGNIEYLRFTFGTTFSIFGLDVSSDSSNPLTFQYDTELRQFEGRGQIMATIPAKQGSSQTPTSVSLLLGYANTPDDPGIIVSDGVLTQLNATVTSNFSLYGIQVSTLKNGLTFAYNRDDEIFELYGSLNVSFDAGGATQRITAQLGNENKPGFEVKDGDLQDLNLSLSGVLNLYGLVVDVTNAGVTYSRDHDEIGLSGSIMFQKLFQASVSLGTAADPGIVIKDGHFELDNLELELGNINLGAFNLQELEVIYAAGTGSDAGGYTFTVKVIVVFPEGWEVGGTISFLNGDLNSLDLFYSVTSGEGIGIGDTGLFLTYIDASIQNLADPSNIIVRGAANFTYGPGFSLLGYDNLSAFVVGGDFSVDRNHLEIAGGFYVGAYKTGTGTDQAPIYSGVIGQGTGSVDLDWGDKVYSAQLAIKYYNDTIGFNGGFAFNDSGDFVIGGKASLNVPSSVPFIGGDNIGSADFLLEYHKGDLSNSFVAAWVTYDVNLKVYSYTVKVGIEFNFDSKSFDVIGGGTIDSYANCISDPSMCLNGNATFTYYAAYNINVNGESGATGANLSVDWPSISGTQSVEVTMPDGTVIPQSQFGTSNGLSLVPGLTNSTQTEVHLVGSTSSPNVPLQPGSYTLTLVSNQQFDPSKVTFASALTYPEPTVAKVAVAANGSTVSSTASSIIPVTLSGTVDEAFKSQTKVTLYVDDVADTDGSRATPVNGASNMPISTDDQGNWTLNPTWNTSGLTPVTKYFVYAVINDGTNTPVSSYSTARSAAINPIEAIYGTVSNTARGPNNGDALSGVIVYLDLNHNGKYDGPVYNSDGSLKSAGEPEVSTNSAGFYNFGPNIVQENTPYDVAVVVPSGYLLDSTNSENTNPRFGVIFNGNPNDQDFGLYQPASIQGTLFEDLNSNGKQDPGEPGLPNRVVDLINTATPSDPPVTVYTDNNGHYQFLITTLGTYTVSPSVSTTEYNTSPTSLTSMLQGTPDNPYPQVVGQDFGSLPYSSISGSIAGYPLSTGGLLPTTTPLSGWTVTASMPKVWINAGSNTSAGSYAADADYTGGASDNISSYDNISTLNISDPAPLAVYSSFRYGKSFSYNIEGFDPNSTQLVRLDFAELQKTAPGQRLFNVIINGQEVLENFDVFEESGDELVPSYDSTTNAVDRVFTTKANGSGMIQIQFVGVVDNAEVNGILISTPVATTTTDANGNYSFTHLVSGSYTISQTLQSGWRATSPSNSTFQVQYPSAAVSVPALPPETGNSYPTTIVVGNFLNDGGDFAVFDPMSSTVWVYPDSNVNDRRMYSVIAGAQFIVAGDFYGTGRQDIAIISASGALQILANAGPNTSSMTLGPIQQTAFVSPLYANNETIYSVAAGKFTTDGAGDQIAVEYGNFQSIGTPGVNGAFFVSLSYFQSDGSLHSDPAIFLSPLTAPYNFLSAPAGSLSVARDKNGYDAMLVCFVGAFPVLFSPSLGTSQVVANQEVALGVLGDINGDGLLDAGLFNVDGQPGVFSYAIQSASGIFTTYNDYPSNTPPVPVTAAALEDVNGDGRLDMVYTEAGYQGFFTQLNTGAAGDYFDYISERIFGLPLPLGVKSLALADINHDGNLDFIIADAMAGQFAIALNTTTTLPGSIMISVANTMATGQNFINTQDGQISGRVFDDVAGDGISTLAKPGLAGATVFLDLNNNGKLDPGEPTALTGSTGLYSFAGVAPGTYSVAIVPMANRRLTTPSSVTQEVSASPDSTRSLGVDFGSTVGIDAVVVVPSDARGDLSVFRNGDRLEVLDGDRGILASYTLSSLNSLTIQGLAGITKSVVISILSGGFFSLPGGLSILGTGAEALSILLGPGADDAVFGSGRVTIDSTLVVSWSNVASVTTDTGAGNDRVIVTAPTPSAPLVIDAGAGDDVVRVDAVASPLQVNGGDGNDTLTASQDPTDILVPITFDGGNGDDTIAAGPRGDTLIGGPGNDQLLGGSGDDTFLWNDGDGNDTIDGGGGNNTVRITTSTTLNDAVVVRPNGSRVSVMMANTAYAALDIGGVQMLDVSTGGGADLIDVTPLAGTAIHVDAGSTDATSGDRLIVHQEVSAGASFALHGPLGGLWSFVDAMPVTFDNVANFNMSAAATQIFSLYQTVLNRQPGADEANAWLSVLAAGASPIQIAKIFWESPEHRGIEVDQFYATYLHRVADPAGRAGWVASLVSGVNEETVEKGFLLSPEYQKAHPSPSDYVVDVYQSVLGRLPSNFELASNIKLARQRAGRLALVNRTLTSVENADQIVADDYKQILGRAGSKVEIKAWSKALRSHRISASTIAERFLASAEFQSKFS